MPIIRTITIGEKNKPAGGVIIKGKAPMEKRFKRPDKIPKNAKNLVVVESPAKAKTIEKFLGPEYRVLASRGHLRDLPKNQLGVDINNDFAPKYINIYGRKELIEELQREVCRSKNVFLATDPDREGEAISWHLSYLLDVNPADKCRVMFHEITKKAVLAAVANPQPINIEKVNAQQARRVLDRIVGYKLSPLLWKKICKGLSAGRVQSVAVRLICEREEEIKAFTPQEYWSVHGVYETPDKELFNTTLVRYGDKKLELNVSDTEKDFTIDNEAKAKQLAYDIEQQPGVVTKVEKKKRKRKAPAPFTTSTMQQEGVSNLNFGAKKTMVLAQQLYEGLDIGDMGHVGLITYMRTDSVRITEDMITAAREYIAHKYGDDYLPAKPIQYQAKQSSQDAHEAIRPTSMELPPKVAAEFLSRDQLRLYTLIWNRFLASQMNPVETEHLSIVVTAGEAEMRATGYKVIFKGFTEVYEAPKKDDSEQLPAIEEGTAVLNKEITQQQHFTQPPARYTEASLIKLLEEKGIGRPSTYAPIMETIQTRNYVEKKEKQFIPTELGCITIDLLKEYFAKIINVSFTAKLEENLDDVERGKDTYAHVLQEFYAVFEEELEVAEDNIEKIKVADQESDEVCDKCGSTMVYKFGRFGKFLACSNFPACHNTKTIIVDLGIECPECGKGRIIQRKSKKGRTFYGCSAYPDCDFILWNKPINERCTKCGSIMVEKTYKNGQTKTFCSNAECNKKTKDEEIKNG